MQRYLNRAPAWASQLVKYIMLYRVKRIVQRILSDPSFSKKMIVPLIKQVTPTNQGNPMDNIISADPFHLQIMLV